MLNICICDDRPEDVEAIRALVERFTQTHREHQAHLTAFQSPFVLVDHLEASGGFDLYLLDMLMPHMTGLELAERIRSRGESAEILFLTVTREYAVEAFGVHAAGYLLKPVGQEEFDQAALHAIYSLAPKENPSLLLKTQEGIRKVPLNSITMIESFDHRRVCTLEDGTTMETADTLGALLIRLEDHPHFFSPHRAYIVNLRYVRGINGTDLLLTNGTKIPVSRKLLPVLKEAFVKCDF